MRIDKLKIDKYFHLYGRKDDVVLEEIEKPEQRAKGEWIEDGLSNSHRQENGWLTRIGDCIVQDVLKTQLTE